MIRRFIESICLIDGVFRNLDFHRLRMEATKAAFPDIIGKINLYDFLYHLEIPQNGKFKLRIIYSKEIERFEIIPYEIKQLNSFKLIENNTIEYPFKFEDRRVFDELKNGVDEDEIILVKNGEITDTSYSNLVFKAGTDWITPRSFLLNGTMRQSLLELQRIREETIRIADLKYFSAFKLINALMDLQESPELPVSCIR